MARPQKATETALWPRRIFSAPMSAKTAGRKIAKGFRRFAKDTRGAVAASMGRGAKGVEKIQIMALETALRFKRCDMPKFSRFHLSYFIVHPSFRRAKLDRTKQTATGINFRNGV